MLGGFLARKCDGEPGYETYMNGTVVLDVMVQFLKWIQDLRDLGLLRLGDELWTKLFGSLEKWSDPPEGEEQRVA